MKIYNGRKSLYQWDLNQKLTSDTLQVGDEVHYSSPKQTTALVTVAYELDGHIVSDIPNILLQNAHLIRVERYVATHNGQCTMKQYSFKVRPKVKPDDYAYTEVEIRNWNALSKRIDEIEEKGVAGIQPDYLQDDPTAKDYIKNKPEPSIPLTAITDVVSDKSTDEEVPSAKAVYNVLSNFQPSQDLSDEDIMDAMAEMELIDPATLSDGTFLITNNEEILCL